MTPIEAREILHKVAHKCYHQGVTAGKFETLCSMRMFNERTNEALDLVEEEIMEHLVSFVWTLKYYG